MCGRIASEKRRKPRSVMWQPSTMPSQKSSPTDSVKPVAVPKDMSSDKITLYIPALTNAVPSGDYEITYKVGNEEVDGPGAVTIPLPKGETTGSSTDVKILFD